ncbi:MAG: peroxiredoxin [Chloroflexia bacterium]|nr:peroxiredoxin [Chloroflexia bacterium]
MTLQTGNPAPEFTLPDENGDIVRLADLSGQRVVLYFYPKDDTSGCTAEACGIRDQFPHFQTQNAKVLGVSPDDSQSHLAFKQKYSLPFALLADTGQTVAEAYGARGPRGTKRITFVIDEQGHIQHVFDKVSPAEHAEELLAILEK